MQGRVVNETGWPVGALSVRVVLLGVPVVTETDCSGEFNVNVPTAQSLTEFDDLDVTVGAVKRSLKTDPWTRRTDLVLTHPGIVTPRCRMDQSVSVWAYRYTVEGRLVERTAEYESEGVKLFARPVVGERVRLTLVANAPDPALNGSRREWVIPDRARNPVTTDGAGNFAFSFVMAEEADRGFRITAENFTKLNVTFADRVVDVTNPDFAARYTYLSVIRSSERTTTPAAGAAALALLALAAAFALRRSHR